MQTLVTIAQLILSLSILVVLHELGHFIPARLFKTRVEKFYLFFNPGFSLFKVKKGETEYGIGWLPLGGYVKIAGMIDESMDKEQMQQPAQPWEFRSKPAWQRLIIMIGGVTVNLILGWLIFSMVLFTWGSDQLPPENAKYGYNFDPVLQEQFGFEDGDILMAVNGETPADADDFLNTLLLDSVGSATVIRGGQTRTIDLPEDFGQLLVDSGLRQPFMLRWPTIIEEVSGGSPASEAGLQVGDKVVGVNDVRSPIFADIQPEIKGHPDEDIVVHIERDGQPMTLTAHTREDGTIGFRPVTEFETFFELRHVEYNLLNMWPAGYRYARNQLTDYVGSLKFLFTKSGAKQIGGFGTIAKIFGVEWDWQRFWDRTAWLSLVLAFMNILPIPALDGGHVLFLLIEMVTGRKPSDKFMERVTLVGVVLLVGLMLYANGMDIWRAVMK